MKICFYLWDMNNTQTHTMKYTTTDKHAHQYETFTASEGPATIVASVNKEGAGWNWFVRVAYLKPDGITYIDDAQGREWSKPEARASFEAAASGLIAQMK